MADTYLSLLEQRRPDIEKMLADWITPERFFAMAMQLERNPALKKCTASSLVECVIMSAQAGLEVGGERGHVYIIPYGDIAQAQIGWRGFAFLKHKTGAIIQLDTEVVFEGDEFNVYRDSLSGDHFRHVPNYKADRSEKSAYAAYAIVKLPTGVSQYEVLGKNRILRHRAHSKQPNGMLWTEFWEEGWRKTPWRVLQKRLPEGINKEAIERYNRALDIEVSQFRADDEFTPPDDMPRATDGTEAPTPRRVKVEVVKEDRLLNTDEQDGLINGWISRGGKASQLSPFLHAHFQVDDMAKIKVSQTSDVEAAMDKEHGVSA